MDVGNSIQVETDWNFRLDPHRFEEHIAQSVPDCEAQRQHIADLARFFLREGSLCTEIGVSTGSLAKAVLEKIPQRKCQYLGLDTEPAMVESAKIGLRHDIRFAAEVADASAYPFGFGSLILSYYTNQFIPLDARQSMFERARRSLLPGGAMILYEKTLAGCAKIQDIYNQLEIDMKLNSGLPLEAVVNKARSLQGISMPVPMETTVQMLKEAGFSHVEVIYRVHSFTGFLALV